MEMENTTKEDTNHLNENDTNSYKKMPHFEETDLTKKLFTKPSLNDVGEYQTFRSRLNHIVESYRFHLIIVGLVVVDCIIVVAELIIDLQIYASGCATSQLNHTKTHDNNTRSSSTGHLIAEILHIISIGILCIFVVEIFCKLYALRHEFFGRKVEVFDAFIVITSLIFDVVFLAHEDVLRFLGLIIVLRLWRVVRVIHGIIISVKAPIEHNLEKEIKIREEMEKEMGEKHLYINSLEIEITSLRGILEKNNIKNVPETYMKIDRNLY